MQVVKVDTREGGMPMLPSADVEFQKFSFAKVNQELWNHSEGGMLSEQRYDVVTYVPAV